MVNVDNLNKTIEKLDLKSKEIETLVEKQNKFDILAKEIQELKEDINKEDINIESKSIVENANEINELINSSKKAAIETGDIIQDKLYEIKKSFEIVINDQNENITNSIEILKKNSVETDKMMKDKLYEIQRTFDIATGEQNKNINEAIEILKNVEIKVKELNSDIIKKLNDIISENYKVINEFQNVLEAKMGLLKSDIALEIRNLETRQETTLANKLQDLKDEIITFKVKSLQIQEENKIINEKAIKKQNIVNIIIIILVLTSIIVRFI